MEQDTFKLFSDNLDELNKQLLKYEEEALLVKRIYPPSNICQETSRLGGLPNLPPHMEWPRAFSRKDSRLNIPLHFLAQINCLELPQTNHLPKQGTLFFFADISRDMVWDIEDPTSYCRVLYDPSSDIYPEVRQPPEDLEITRGTWSKKPIKYYPGWPIEFFKMRSWPVTSSYPYRWWENKDTKPYDRLRYTKVVSELFRVFPMPLASQDWKTVGFKKIASNLSYCFLPTDFASNFQYTWGMVQIFASIIKDRCQDKITKGSTYTKSSINQAVDFDYENILNDADRWLKRSMEKDFFLALSHDPSKGNDEKRSFEGWLRAITNVIQDYSSRFRSITEITAPVMGRAIHESMSQIILLSAQDCRLRSLIPKSVYQAMENDHLILQAVPDTNNQNNFWNIYATSNAHQMLGWTSTAQDFSFSTEENKTVLLQLESDRILDFLFCDCGEITFIINKDDLQNNYFENVYAITSGG